MKLKLPIKNTVPVSDLLNSGTKKLSRFQTDLLVALFGLLCSFSDRIFLPFPYILTNTLLVCQNAQLMNFSVTIWADNPLFPVSLISSFAKATSITCHAWVQLQFLPTQHQIHLLITHEIRYVLQGRSGSFLFAWGLNFGHVWGAI